MPQDRPGAGAAAGSSGLTPAALWALPSLGMFSSNLDSALSTLGSLQDAQLCGELLDLLKQLPGGTELGAALLAQQQQQRPGAAGTAPAVPGADAQARGPSAGQGDLAALTSLPQWLSVSMGLLSERAELCPGGPSSGEAADTRVPLTAGTSGSAPATASGAPHHPGRAPSGGGLESAAESGGALASGGRVRLAQARAAGSDGLLRPVAVRAGSEGLLPIQPLATEPRLGPPGSPGAPVPLASGGLPSLPLLGFSLPAGLSLPALPTDPPGGLGGSGLRSWADVRVEGAPLSRSLLHLPHPPAQQEQQQQRWQQAWEAQHAAVEQPAAAGAAPAGSGLAGAHHAGSSAALTAQLTALEAGGAGASSGIHHPTAGAFSPLEPTAAATAAAAVATASAEQTCNAPSSKAEHEGSLGNACDKVSPNASAPGEWTCVC